MIRGLIMLLVILSHPLLAQQPADSIHVQFDRWKAAHPRVMPFAILNQHKFMPGDTVFFKLYFLTENLHRVEGRRILHLTLINDRGVTCGLSDFGIKDGVGFNQLMLPDTLSQGFYRITFNNEWMERFQPSEYFQEEIAVVTGKSVAYQHNNKLSFFAEGGNFVQGIANKIVIKGSPDLKGELLDQEASILSTFRLNAAGIGFVLFTPQPGHQYKLRFGESTVDLPSFLKDGLSLLVSAGQKGSIRTLIAAPAGSALCSDDLYVLLTSQGTIQYSLKVKLGAGGYANIQIPDRNLPHGPALMSVINKSGETLARRHLFIDKKIPLIAKLHAALPEVQGRSLLSVALDLRDSSGTAQQAEFLLSAANNLIQKDEPAVSFEDEISLALHGLDIVEYRKHSVDLNSVDLWMITQQQPEVPWKNIINGEFTQTAPMNTLLHKIGRVTLRDAGTPVPESTRVMVLLQRELVNYEVSTGPAGLMELPFLFDFWGEDDMIYRAEYQGLELGPIQLSWELDTTKYKPASAHQLVSDDDPYVTFNVKKRLMQRSYLFYSSEQGKVPVVSDPNAVIEDEFGGADITVNMEDYVIFPDMVEMIREVIPSLRHRKQKGKSVVRVLYSDHTHLTTADPLYVIDGIMTNNTDFFLGLKPSDLISIKLVTEISKLRRFGPMSSNGVVLVHTRGIDLKPLKRLNNSVTVQGLTKEVSWKAPVHEVGSRTPDFRTTLFWAPMMSTQPSANKNVTFETSDDIGPVKIVVKGISAAGQPYSADATVNIEFRKN